MISRFAFTVAEAAAAARIGRTLLFKKIRQGELPARKVGRRTLILAPDLEKWISELPPRRVRKDG
jgi:excisionase family DNA binding protein